MKYKCIYLSGKKELVDDPYELGRLSFIELEKIFNSFGYQQGDMIYYLRPDKSLDDDSVIRMIEYLQ
jgi:hypothetical protein